MIQSLVVIDDFLADPERFRKIALDLEYVGKGPYPGRNSRQHIEMHGLDAFISAVARERVRGMSPLQSHAHCRLTLESDNDAPAKIHVDPSHWSGILYLSRSQDCRGGTEFFRHLPTGTDRVPRDLESLKSHGFASYDEFKEVSEKDAFDRSKWQVTMNVPMAFNRLVLIQPQYWHTAGPGFGETVEDGRLVYLMFFRRVDLAGPVATNWGL